MLCMPVCAPWLHACRAVPEEKAGGGAADTSSFPDPAACGGRTLVRACSSSHARQHAPMLPSLHPPCPWAEAPGRTASEPNRPPPAKRSATPRLTLKVRSIGPIPRIGLAYSPCASCCSPLEGVASRPVRQPARMMRVECRAPSRNRHFILDDLSRWMRAPWSNCNQPSGAACP